MTERQTGPRFHPKTVIPEVPEGMELVKFYGELALIPAKDEGEEMFGKSRFSLRQVEALIKLEQKRQRRETLGKLDDLLYPVQYVIAKIYQEHPDKF